jgi:hypothetical protein
MTWDNTTKIQFIYGEWNVGTWGVAPWMKEDRLQMGLQIKVQCDRRNQHICKFKFFARG